LHGKTGPKEGQWRFYNRQAVLENYSEIPMVEGGASDCGKVKLTAFLSGLNLPVEKDGTIISFFLNDFFIFILGRPVSGLLDRAS
jgi:hypothetical protein